MHVLVILLLVGLIVFFLYKTRYLGQSTSTHGEALSSFEAEITDDEFESMVIETSKKTPVLVDFYATWCAPCKAFTPILSQLAADYQGAFLLGKMDVDKNPKVVEQYGIRSMPTILLFKNGEVVERFSGGKAPHSLTFLLTQHGIEIPQKPEQSA
ncbi:MAG: hypothetical protein RLZZ422_242 [Pseudomonadota bacterium]|jgi:putative thioredoxin